MRIGIVSLYRTLKFHQNYGTLLQNYALQSHLRKKGHETFWIRTIKYRSRGYSNLKKININDMYHTMKFAFRRMKYAIRSPLPRTNEKYLLFFKKNVPHTNLEYDYDTLLKDPPIADAYISGSDQVWSHAFPLFFLEFAPPLSICIAYAASAKWQRISELWLKAAEGRLQKFDAVSVREIDGIAICRMLGRDDAHLVLDPVFLLTGDEYRALVEGESVIEDHSQQFLWQYMVDQTEKSASNQVIRHFAECNGLEIKTDAIRGGTKGKRSTAHSARRTPTEWIDAFDKSKYVITNSFHGTVFSIIFEKPFLVLLREGEKESGNARILSLLKLLGLDTRAVKESELDRLSLDEFGLRLLAPVAWCDVRERLTMWRDRSIQFLDEALDTGNPK